MGFMDYVSDLYASLTIQSAEAEEQAADTSDSNEGGDGESEEKSSEGEGEGGDEEGGSEEGGDDAGGDEEEEEEEEEEDEPEDPKAKLEEECMRTAQCAPLKYHYDECAERVQQQHETHGKAHEDCVEEYFHMMHCATQCAAPKLFKQLR